MRIATFRQPQVVCEPSKPQLGAEMSCFHDTFDLCLRVQGLWLEEYCMSFKGQHSTGFSQRFTQWNFSSQAIKFQHVSTIDVPRNQPIDLFQPTSTLWLSQMPAVGCSVHVLVLLSPGGEANDEATGHGK